MYPQTLALKDHKDHKVLLLLLEVLKDIKDHKVVEDLKVLQVGFKASQAPQLLHLLLMEEMLLGSLLQDRLLEQLFKL